MKKILFFKDILVRSRTFLNIERYLLKDALENSRTLKIIRDKSRNAMIFLIPICQWMVFWRLFLNSSFYSSTLPYLKVRNWQKSEKSFDFKHRSMIDWWREDLKLNGAFINNVLWDKKCICMLEYSSKKKHSLVNMKGRKSKGIFHFNV